MTKKSWTTNKRFESLNITVLPETLPIFLFYVCTYGVQDNESAQSPISHLRGTTTRTAIA